MSHIYMSHARRRVSKKHIKCAAACCPVLQCVAVCCRVLQYVAVCCRVLQCHYSVTHTSNAHERVGIRKMLHELESVTMREGWMHMCDLTHSHVWHDSCVTWLTHMCDMAHSHVWHDSFTCRKAHELQSMTAGWRRRIGSPKLQIILHNRASKHRSLLQKMTHKNKGSYESSPLPARERPDNLLCEDISLFPKILVYVRCSLLHLECHSISVSIRSILSEWRLRLNLGE